MTEVFGRRGEGRRYLRAGTARACWNVWSAGLLSAENLNAASHMTCVSVHTSSPAGCKARSAKHRNENIKIPPAIVSSNIPRSPSQQERTSHHQIKSYPKNSLHSRNLIRFPISHLPTIISYTRTRIIHMLSNGKKRGAVQHSRPSAQIKAIWQFRSCYDCASTKRGYLSPAQDGYMKRKVQWI
jgi:hypothetical protein